MVETNIIAYMITYNRNNLKADNIDIFIKKRDLTNVESV